MALRLWTGPNRDVDITRLHLRGQNVAIINGAARAQPDDLASLLADFRGTFGTDIAVVYVSKDGWQVFDGVKPPSVLSDVPTTDEVHADAAALKAALNTAPDATNAPRRGKGG